MRIESMLVASDFSTWSDRAVERAACLGPILGLQSARVVHVVEPTLLESVRRWFGDAAELEPRLHESALQRLQQQIDAVPPRFPFTLSGEVLEGRVVDRLHEAAEDATLLVVGAQGSHRVRERVIGTCAQRLAGKATAPILVVRSAVEGPYRRVLIGIDLAPVAARALAQSVALAPDAEHHALHVFEYPEGLTMNYAGVSQQAIESHREQAMRDSQLDVANLLRECGFGSRLATTRVEAGYPATALLAAAEKMDADLIVVGKHGRSLTEELLLGSVTLHLLAEAPCDVLVVH